MERNLGTLAQTHFDVLIIGGGIYGAWIAWEASLRGLSVALAEKDDFCSATSANSLKTIHGGLRYLQHADFKRMRESISERTTLMRVAPHLMHPLPVLVPTYGHALKGREVMAAAMVMNDIVSFDRNRLPDPQKHIPHGYTISRSECLRLLPGIPENGLTGGAVFYDAQAYNTERLVIALLQSAAQRGAQSANYLKVVGFLRKGSAVVGVVAQDYFTGDTLTIRAKTVINTAGPWADHVLGYLNPSQPKERKALSANIITRSLFEKYAVGLSAPRSYSDADAVLNKGSRLLFFSPWRGRCMIGTTADPYDGDPDSFQVTEAYLQRFVDEVNQAFPPARLSLDDITFVHAGILPSSGVDTKSGDARIAKHYQIYDHRQQGVDGLVTVIGVKYTTARNVAEKVVDHLFRRMNRKPPRSMSAFTQVQDGQVDRFTRFLQGVVNRKPYGLDEIHASHLVYNYGSTYPNVLHFFDSLTAEQHGQQKALLKAETLYATHNEMALKLSDVLLRRTDWGSAAHPGMDMVRFCADVMAAELGWTPARVQQEINEVNGRYPSWRGIHAEQLADTTVQQVGTQTA